MTNILTKETTTPPTFDYAAHAAAVDDARAALAAAEEAEANALAEAEAKAELLEELEADLGSGSVTPAALTKARTASEIAAAVADEAARVRKAAARRVDQLNPDHDLADALLPFAQRLVHPSVPVLAVPAPLAVAPDLADLRPVLVVRQQQSATHDRQGHLSTITGSRLNATHDKPVLLEFHFIAGLHSAPSGEDVFTTAGRSSVGLHGQQAHDVRVRNTIYPGAHGEEVTKRTFELNVIGVLPELPTLDHADPKRIASHVKFALRTPFEVAGDPRAASDCTPTGNVASSRHNGITTSTVSLSAWVLSRVGEHNDQVEFVRRAAASLNGQGIAGAGRVKSARLVDTGKPEVRGSHYGWQDIALEVTTEHRQA